MLVTGYYNQSNLGRVAKVLLTFYDEKLEEPVSEEIQWVEGINIVDSKLIISYRNDGHEMIDKPYDVKTLRNLVLI